MRFSPCLVLAATVVAAGAAGAQVRAGQTLVTPRIGAVAFDKASGIEAGGFVGVEATYALTSMFSIGAGLSVAQANTRGEDFISTLTFGDTTYLYQVTQPLSVLNAEVVGMARLPFTFADRFSPFLTAGVGGYTLYLDPQQNAGPRRFARMSGSVGGGLNIALGRAAGIQLDVRDMIFTDYKRDRLNPTEARFTGIRFPEDVPVPPKAKEIVHNLMFSLGFSFRPGAGADDDRTDDNTTREGTR
jgi:hypothetical protein